MIASAAAFGLGRWRTMLLAVAVVLHPMAGQSVHAIAQDDVEIGSPDDKSGRAPAVQLLATALESEDVETRRRAALATRSADRATQRALLPVFSTILKDEKDGQVRLAVLATVTDMGPDASAAVDALATAMIETHGGKFDEETHQDYRAALALAAIGKPSIDVLIGLLKAERSNVPIEAALALGRLGDDAVDAVDPLLASVRNGKEPLRLAAAQALAGIGEASVPGLVELCGSPDEPHRHAAVSSLVAMQNLNRAAMSAVSNALDDESPKVRASALRAIESVGLPDGLRRDRLVGALSDDDATVRLASVNLLHGKPDELRAIRGELLSLLRDPRSGVVHHAAFLLQQQGPDVIPQMLDAVEDRPDESATIGNAIATMGLPAVDRLLQAVRESTSGVGQRADGLAAAIALGKIRPVDERVIEAMVNGLDGTDSARVLTYLQATSDLGETARSAKPAVVRQLQNVSPEVRSRAIEVLFRIAPRDDDLLAAWIGMVWDEVPAVQERAIATLKTLGPRSHSALPAVVEKLSSSDQSVRDAAASFVRSHGSSAASAVPVLSNELSGPDRSWRLTVIRTIGEIGSSARPAFDPLMDLQEDEDAEIRSAAVKAIGSLGVDSQQLFKCVEIALSDGDADVRNEALRIVRRLGKEAVPLLPQLIATGADEDARRSVDRILDRWGQVEISQDVVARLKPLTNHESSWVAELAEKFIKDAESQSP